MTYPRTPRTVHTALLVVLLMVAAAQIWDQQAAVGQTEPFPVQGIEIDDLALDEPWVDPIERFELVDEPLADVPDFDFGELHAESAVFEAGVQGQAVNKEADVATETDQHLRALQAVATAEQARATVDDNIAEAQATIVDATRSITQSRQTIAGLEREIAQAEREIARIVEAETVEADEQLQRRADIDLLNAAILEIAMQAFTGEDLALETFVADPDSTVLLERRVIGDQVREFQVADIEGAEQLLARSLERTAALVAERAPLEASNQSRVADIASEHDAIDRMIEERIEQRLLISELNERGEVLDGTIEDTLEYSEVTAVRYEIAYHQRLDAFVAGTDIPLVALNAYVRASRTLAVNDPGCGIHWSQLAGIGRIESRHGYFANSTLDVNGRTTVQILGLPLDGRVLSGGTSGPLPDATGQTQETSGVVRLARITDTDNGVLDGDRIFDRAVGPMQFIPTTWSLFEADGDGDGKADPQNIYDAALAAASYLCAAPGSMLTSEGEQRAYFAYNHDLAYSADVTRAGRRYHDQLNVSPESTSFAAFARLPTPEEIVAVDVLPFVEEDLDEPSSSGLEITPDSSSGSGNGTSSGSDGEVLTDSDDLGEDGLVDDGEVDEVGSEIDLGDSGNAETLLEAGEDGETSADTPPDTVVDEPGVAEPAPDTSVLGESVAVEEESSVSETGVEDPES